MDNSVDEMTEVERFRRWIDIADGKAAPAEGCEIESVTESEGGRLATIIIRRKSGDTHRP